MAHPKRRPASHVTGDEAVHIVRDILPHEWVIREYKPDYGIDLAIELFEPAKEGVEMLQTLGEHLFVQVKGTTKLETISLTVEPRLNVERFPLSHRAREAAPQTLEAIPFPIDTSDLVTVRKMGAGIPVLLFVVDTSAARLFFICLNDYIDKIILPEDPNYGEKATKTIHIPLSNEITKGRLSLIPLRFYAMRPKLYAAFQKFQYQEHELGYVSPSNLVEQGKFFAQLLLQYDFWEEHQPWALIPLMRFHLQSFVTTGSPKLMKRAEDIPPEVTEGLWTGGPGFSVEEGYTFDQIMLFDEIRALWHQLVSLARTYEEVCREWFLPTHLGLLSS
jgi:hypothetical protein